MSGDIPFEEVLLPKNKSNLCWFDSVNVALFHKKRPELEEVIANPEGVINVDNLPKESLDKIYDLYYYFSGQHSKINSLSKSIKDLYINFREDLLLQDFFNSKGQGGLQIQGQVYQDASEYIQGFLKLPNFETAISCEGNNKTVPFWLLQPGYQCRLLDIVMGLESCNKIHVTEKTHTLLVDTGLQDLKGKTLTVKDNLEFLETITIPEYDGETFMKETTFTLDSLVVHTGGAHYFCVIRTKDGWRYYNDLEIDSKEEEAQSLKQIKESFPEILTDDKEYILKTQAGVEGTAIDTILEAQQAGIQFENIKPTYPDISATNFNSLISSLLEKEVVDKEKLEKAKGEYARLQKTNQPMDFTTMKQTLLTTRGVNVNQLTKLLIYSRDKNDSSISLTDL